MKYILTIFLTLLTFTVVAQERDESFLNEAMLPAVNDWVMDNSDFGRPMQDLPEIQIIDDAVWILSTGLSQMGAATYTRELNLIFMKSSVVNSDRVDVFLAHELIHFYQIHTDREYNCLGEMEKEAYEYQEKFGKQKFAVYYIRDSFKKSLERRAKCVGVVGFDKRKLR